jgi:aspartyl-tRNA(Asn)/glutamyl-tRNA(Gln) amidotransferase subunit C
MKLAAKDVEHVALLSRLQVTEAEKQRYAEELSKIFHYVDQLNELDVTDVEPTSHSLPMRNVFRRDVVVPGLTNAEALANAAQSEDGCFKVPQIV